MENGTPAVKAGPNQSIIGNNETHLAVSVVDDNLPQGNSLTRQWSVVAGNPLAVTFDDITSPTATLSFGSMWLFAPDNFVELNGLLHRLADASDGLSAALWDSFSPESQA